MPRRVCGSQAAKKVKFVFCGGVYVAKNTLRVESVFCPPAAGKIRGSERNPVVKKGHRPFLTNITGSGSAAPCYILVVDQQAAGVEVVAGIVALAEGADDDTIAGAGVDEPAAADIDADVLNDAAAEPGEEHQIARLPLRIRDAHARAVLRGGRVGQGVAEVAEHPHRKAGAVDAGIARAAVDIGRAEIGLGELNELLADGACRGRPLIVGVVHRLAVVGADIARGAAEGDLIPAVICRVEQVRDLAGADGAHDGGARARLGADVQRIAAADHHAVVAREDVRPGGFRRLSGRCRLLRLAELLRLHDMGLRRKASQIHALLAVEQPQINRQIHALVVGDRGADTVDPRGRELRERLGIGRVVRRRRTRGLICPRDGKIRYKRRRNQQQTRQFSLHNENTCHSFGLAV